jgi:hypothetical protein
MDLHVLHTVAAYLIAHLGTGAGGVHLCDGFLGIGGSSSGTDRKNLNNIFNTGLTQGTSDLTQGGADTSKAAGYNSGILGGDRSSIMQALSPEISGITGRADAQRKEQANLGTSRTGGTNADNQQQQQRTDAQVSNLIGTARPQAAQQLASIGANQSGLGTNLLGLGEKTVADMYPTDVKKNQETGQAAGQIASALLFGL